MNNAKVPWTLGFRPFFILAGLTATLLLGLWVATYQGIFSPQSYYPPTIWHGHEMLFGFTVAILAGFFLTAVHNWTGLPTVHHHHLLLISLLWFLGRIAPFFTFLPTWMIGAIDMLFLPALTTGIALPILQKKMWRNIVFPIILLALTVVNGLIHLHIQGLPTLNPMDALVLAMDLTLLILVWIFGRIYPFFANRVMPENSRIRNWPQIEILAIASIAVIALSRLLVPQWLPHIMGPIALIHIIRLYGYHDKGIWKLPMIWILFSGYCWLVIAFLAEAFAQRLPISPLALRHLYTVGAIGVITTGMMVRVSLGHTGRPIVANGFITSLFVLINLTVVLRVLGPLLQPLAYSHWISVSGVIWCLVFLGFLIKFTPILLTPRPDGRPG